MSDRSLWETHAAWWIEGFTDGADPEYEEQILPWRQRSCGGHGGCSMSVAGDGQISRLAAG